jgi:hypothetical protein
LPESTVLRHGAQRDRSANPGFTRDYTWTRGWR